MITFMQLKVPLCHKNKILKVFANLRNDEAIKKKTSLAVETKITFTYWLMNSKYL